MWRLAASRFGTKSLCSRDMAKIRRKDALDFHTSGRPGKIQVVATKPLTTQRDLSLAYSPGVAVPCLRIAEDETAAYDYTARGNIGRHQNTGCAIFEVIECAGAGSL